jgi:dolichyl-phosphate beta-glucosyltransferase
MVSERGVCTVEEVSIATVLIHRVLTDQSDYSIWVSRMDRAPGMRRGSRLSATCGRRPNAMRGRGPADTLPGMVESLGLILPAYNEASRLGPALDELFAYLHSDAARALPDRVCVLVVDDGSTDGTAALVRARSEFGEGSGEPRDGHELRLLTVPHGGKGSAVRAGMLECDGDVLVFADADMATPPDMLPRLLAALETADVALGSRIQPDGSDMRASQPVFRRIVGRAFRLGAQLWVTGPVKDTQCGFKGFRREVARDLFSRMRVTSIVFDVDLIFLARRRGYKIAIVSIVWADRRGSRMQARPGLALRVAWDLVRIRFLHRDARAGERLRPES